MNQAQQPRQTIIIPSEANFGQIIAQGVKTFAKRHKVITGSYLFGLLVLILAGSGTKLSLDQQRQYNRIMNTIDLSAEFDASNRYGYALAAYRSSKGWFTCDSLCKRNKKRMEDAKRQLDDIRMEGYNRMSDAKSVAGLFSEIGVGEVKESFWEYFTSGKQFAKRQSMWDAMFIGLRSMRRDEKMMDYIVKVLIQVLLNISIGLVMALIFFVIGLWSLIQSYQPNPLSALVFFVSAVCAAFAFVFTYLFVIYGAAVGGVYGMAKLAETSMRIENERRGHQQPRMQYRPHYN